MTQGLMTLGTWLLVAGVVLVPIATLLARRSPSNELTPLQWVAGGLIAGAVFVFIFEAVFVTGLGDSGCRPGGVFEADLRGC